MPETRMPMVHFTAESVVEALNQLHGRERCLVLASVATSWLLSYPVADRQGAWDELMTAINVGMAHEGACGAAEAHAQ